MSAATPTRALRSDPSVRWRGVAAASAGVMALIYLLIYAGVLSVGRAEGGDLAILGVAGGAFAVLAALLWWVRRRLVWIAAVVLQLGTGAMYVAVAPEREPGFELWGVLLRGLSVVVLVAVVMLFVTSRRGTTQMS